MTASTRDSEIRYNNVFVLYFIDLNPQIERYRNMYSPSFIVMTKSAPLNSAYTIHGGLSIGPYSVFG